MEAFGNISTAEISSLVLLKLWRDTMPSATRPSCARRFEWRLEFPTFASQEVGSEWMAFQTKPIGHEQVQSRADARSLKLWVHYRVRGGDS